MEKSAYTNTCTLLTYVHVLRLTSDGEYVYNIKYYMTHE